MLNFFPRSATTTRGNSSPLLWWMLMKRTASWVGNAGVSGWLLLNFWVWILLQESEQALALQVVKSTCHTNESLHVDFALQPIRLGH